MKKTVTANIAGTVFHIEEDAYEKMQRYLAGIRANFSGSPGAEEIMGDIESRIAELFTERLTGRGVVTIEDVRHVESVMGRPEDFADSPTGDPPVDSTGSGTHGTATVRKRFMRDPEDRWVGGVMGGLGAYIGMDPLWLRIGMIVLVTASVGSLVPIYILLWILVPKADSAADRLQMRGEPVTVDNIKRVVEEGADRFKQGGERWANEAKDMSKDWGPRAQSWGKDASRRAGSAGQSAAIVIRKLIGVFLIVVAFGMLLSLMMGLIGGTFSLWSFASWNSDSMGLLDLGGLLFASTSHMLWFAIGVFVLLAVPVLGLFLAGFQLLFDTRAPKWLGWTLAILWFAALVPTIISGMDLASDFRRENSVRTEIPLIQPASGTMYLDRLAGTDSTYGWSWHYQDGDLDVDVDMIQVENGMVRGAWGRCDVERSNDSLFHLVVIREAHARNAKTAMVRAEHIGFDHKQEGDVLFLSPWIRFTVEDKWRAQDLQFTLQVPDGRSVFFREGSQAVIYDIKNVTNTLDRDMIGRSWTMTPDGLKDTRTLRKIEEAPADTTNKGPMAATVWRGPKRPKPQQPVTRRTEAVTVPSPANVQLPSVYALLSRVVTL